MKKPLLFFSILLSLNVFAQKHYLSQQHNQRLGNGGFQPSQVYIGERDSFYTYGLDLNLSVWNLNTKVVNFVYDSLQHQLSFVYQGLNSGNWVNSQKYTYTYDANNNETSQLLQFWTSGAWSNANLSTFTYDTNNNRIHALYQGWTGVWANQYQSTYTFNTHNKMIHQLYQGWSTGSSIWINSENYTYIYDTTTYNMTSEIDSTWSGTAWQNSEKHFYTYDVNHNKTIDSSLIWINPAWKTYSKVNYTYDAHNNNTSFIYQKWDTTHWVKTEELDYTYDANNILSLQMQQDYNATGTALTARDSTVFYFTTVPAICHSSISYTLTQDTAPQTWDVHPFYPANVDSVRWYWGDGTFTDSLYPSHTYTVAGKYNICLTAYASCGDSTVYCQNDSVYRYSNNSTLSNMVYVNVINPNKVTGISAFNTKNAGIIIYPNPAQNNFTVKVSDNNKQALTIFDINGKQVLSQTITGTTNIDAGNLNSGVYNISITSNDGVTNKRLVIVK